MNPLMNPVGSNAEGKLNCINAVVITHVGAKLVLLRFSLQEKHPTASLLLLFRKKSRSAYLFGCKRPHDGSLSLPAFCESQGVHPIAKMLKKSFMRLLQMK